MRCLAFLVGFVLVIGPASAQPLTIHRTVSAEELDALGAPVSRIAIPKAFRYLGARRFILGGFDDVELHVFAQVTKVGRIKRLYWIQFEGYLPNDPQYAHTYTSRRTVEIAGLGFIVDAWPHNSPPAPGSDDAQMQRLLESKGLQLPERAPAVRLVHLDKAKRNELMIIYMEDRAAEADRDWRALRDALLRRAVAGISITP
jgi:hypothetical protein